MPPAPLLVLEGVGSGSRSHAGLITALVWVEVPPASGSQRGLARDGVETAEHLPAWALSEQEHFDRDGHPRPGRPGRRRDDGARPALLEYRLQRCNHVIMMTNEDLERVRGWFAGRLPDEWKVEAPDVTVDREEITVILTIADVESAEGTSERRARRGPGGPGQRVPRGHPPQADVHRRRGPEPGSTARSRGASGWPASPTRPPCSPTWPRR